MVSVFHANLLRPWRFPLRWVYTPGATVMQRICDVAFNIAIPSQRQRMSSLVKIFVARMIANYRSRVEIILTF
jgi:hypothetical protein